MEDESIVVGRSQDAASSDSTDVAEAIPGGRLASAALDVADCTSGASSSPAPSGPSSHRAGAVGTAPSPATTPEAALRSALGLCDYLLRHWAGPGEIGDMPSVASTRDDVLAGLRACPRSDQEAPPRPTLLAETHARVRALAAGYGTTCLQVAIWDNRYSGDGSWRRRIDWRASVFPADGSHAPFVQVEAQDKETVLARLAAGLGVYDTPDCTEDVVALGELPEVTT